VSKRKRSVPGVSVYQRGGTWSYRLDIGAHPLTGERMRENKGGFEDEDAAWDAALKSKATHEQGRNVKPSRRKLSEFMTEWLATIKDTVKPSTYQNYVDYNDAYVSPTIGGRVLQGDVTVQLLNTFYRHLLDQGRRKPDNNTAMHEYWSKRKNQRDGQGPTPAEISRACGTTIYAARAAVLRYRRGRVPTPRTAGLAPKTVKNIHRMLHRAFKDAVAWDYITFNPTEHASLPRTSQRKGRNRPKPWTVDELARWLTVALTDRFAALWVLAATAGMRRSELAGADRDGLDVWALCPACELRQDVATEMCSKCGSEALELHGALTIADTRVVVDGKAEDSDGKSEDSVRTISLDSFTVAHLVPYVAKLDEERRVFGAAYPDHGKLMVYEDGKALHPDTVTRRFNRLVDAADVRRIRLHDVRHTYATLSLDEGVSLKIVSDRIGHADTTVTGQIYVHKSTGHDRDAAELIGKLIREAIERRAAS
jgi:integrase